MRQILNDNPRISGTKFCQLVGGEVNEAIGWLKQGVIEGVITVEDGETYFGNVAKHYTLVGGTVTVPEWPQERQSRMRPKPVKPDPTIILRHLLANNPEITVSRFAELARTEDVTITAARRFLSEGAENGSIRVREGKSYRGVRAKHHTLRTEVEMRADEGPVKGRRDLTGSHRSPEPRPKFSRRPTIAEWKRQAEEDIAAGEPVSL
jgi:hypothetical protein